MSRDIGKIAGGQHGWALRCFPRWHVERRPS
jgi:hypothetical protein